MAVDEILLEGGGDGEGVLRFYRWARPALSIGYFQSVDKIVQLFDCEAQKLWVVRRPTGGGVVRHGEDLTLSISVPENHPMFAGGVSDSYRAVHTVILEALLPMFPGLAFSACEAPRKARSERLCFEEPVACDVEWRGQKVIGSSQRRKNGRLLHQTSVQLPENAAEMARRIACEFEKHWNLRTVPGQLFPQEKNLAEARRTAAVLSADWAFVPSMCAADKHPVCS